MIGYPIGTIALVIVAVNILWLIKGPDRLYLTDKAALAIIVAMILGGDDTYSFGGVDVSVTSGAIIPLHWLYMFLPEQAQRRSGLGLPGGGNCPSRVYKPPCI